ncbi:ERF family protein [Novosphingobium rhizovicinum]|uniref:ERF family protein n=1 Tax=Novosphingobium rhizovicinum TaxID=3228928 RepID=A0ABV3RCR7_9SPHN
MNAQTRIEAAHPPAVYAKIAAVQADLAKEGIGKDRSNQQQKYKFRGIDDVYNALAPLLARHSLSILPRMLSREVVERKSNSGGALFNVTVEAEFDFIAAEDGSRHVVRTFGEAMDSADKATNKAMSAAYKYAALMAFAIPTEGDNDADATTHDVAPCGQNGGSRGGQAASEPEGMPDAAWAQLANLLKATSTADEPLLKHYGVKNLRLLNKQQYDDAVERLEQRLADMAKDQSNRAGQADGGETADIDPNDIPY